MLKILLNENLSPIIAQHLKDKGHDVKLVRDICKGADDEVVADIALKERRVILTQDIDLGYIYYFSHREKLKVIVLRPKIQSIENVIDMLNRFLKDIESGPTTGLFLVKETNYKILR